MNDLMGRSRILVLASHSVDLVKSICNKAVLMQEGQIMATGSTDEILDEYYKNIHHS
jgi:ABC-type polysaccharide/polyol phosphate transport system ATPase subunit